MIKNAFLFLDAANENISISIPIAKDETTIKNKKTSPLIIAKQST